MKQLIIACFALYSIALQAQVTIIAMDIPGLHQEDGHGTYDEIITKALVNEGIAKLVVLPPARAAHKFAQCTKCCLSPSNKKPEFYDYGNELLVTNPMVTAKAYIFTSKDKPIISDLEGLKGKNVGARIGETYGKYFYNSGIKVSYLNTIESNIKKLDAGRIDAFVAYAPDVNIVFEKLGIPPYPHDKTNPVAIHPDSLLCRGVSDQFIEHFNKSL